jgi:hypothetical protein
MHLILNYLLILLLLLTYAAIPSTSQSPRTKISIYHYTSLDWGYSHSGTQHCKNNRYTCEWAHSSSLEDLSTQHNININNNTTSSSDVSVSLYNMHYLWSSKRSTAPHCKMLNTTYTLAESEEAQTRFFELFTKSQRTFDGLSVCAPDSAVPRVYEEAFLNR